MFFFFLPVVSLFMALETIMNYVVTTFLFLKQNSTSTNESYVAQGDNNNIFRQRMYEKYFYISNCQRNVELNNKYVVLRLYQSLSESTLPVS